MQSQVLNLQENKFTIMAYSEKAIQRYQYKVAPLL